MSATAAKRPCPKVAHAPEIEGEKLASLTAEENANHTDDLGTATAGSMVAQLMRHLGYSAEGSLRRSERSEKQRLWMSTQSVHALDPRNRASRDGAALLLLTPEAHDKQVAVHGGLSVHAHVGCAPIGVEDAEHHLRVGRAQATSSKRVEHVSEHSLVAW